TSAATKRTGGLFMASPFGYSHRARWHAIARQKLQRCFPVHSTAPNREGMHGSCTLASERRPPYSRRKTSAADETSAMSASRTARTRCPLFEERIGREFHAF